MITLTNGLKKSLIILEIMRNDEEFNSKISLHIGTFTNCREVGLTYVLCGAYDDKNEYYSLNAFTWCTYEHRNSDEIIINGKEGFVSFNGDLPYMADNKYTCLGSFRYNEYEETADALIKMITEKANVGILERKTKEETK